METDNQFLVIQARQKLSPVKVDDLTPIAKRIFRQRRRVTVNELFQKARHRIPGSLAGYQFALLEMVRRGEFRLANRLTLTKRGC